MHPTSTETMVDETRRADAAGLYRALRLPRTIEEKMLRLIRQGRLSKWFSGFGQEAIAVGCALALNREDYILPMHRNLGVWTTREVPLEKLFCQLMGREGGYTGGRDRSFHFGLPEYRIIGMISHLAAMLPVATGLGLAAQMKKEPHLALAFVGEGSTREGDFHEALSLAGIWKLPVIFVIENNQYGLSTPVHEAIPIENLADAAPGYGIAGEVVDGNDLLGVMDSVRRAAERARSGEGPTLLEMKTFRMRGHEEASGIKYVPPHLFDIWSQKDPVERFRRYLLEEALVAENQLEEMDADLRARVDRAAEFALARPQVTGDEETERGQVFAPAPATRLEPSGEIRERRFVDAISDGLREAMERDDKTLLLGQDIAEYGGVFKITEGFVERFGRERVRNTPIIESGAVGCAMGLALEGFKPVLEMQYMDFISCGFNQIVNNLATTHYRWGAPVNVTIRGPFGGSVGAGPFHSQSNEAWFCHVPGLKVVIPSTPADAKGLLISSIEEPNPVIFFEHKFLYRSLKGPVPEGVYHVPLGSARRVREGENVTIVTWGIGVHWALEAASGEAESGREIEIIDLRTLVPWDRPSVFASVKKTGRLLVLHEAGRTGGFGAEIAATIAEEAFEWLDAPPVRVASLDMPVPFSVSLERNVYSARRKLDNAIKNLLEY